MCVQTLTSSSGCLLELSLIYLMILELVTRRYELVIRGFELVSRGFELVTRGFELVTRRFELITPKFQLVTRVFEFVTRVFDSDLQIRKHSKKPTCKIKGHLLIGNNNDEVLSKSICFY